MNANAPAAGMRSPADLDGKTDSVEPRRIDRLRTIRVHLRPICVFCVTSFFNRVPYQPVPGEPVFPRPNLRTAIVNSPPRLQRGAVKARRPHADQKADNANARRSIERAAAAQLFTSGPAVLAALVHAGRRPIRVHLCASVVPTLALPPTAPNHVSDLRPRYWQVSLQSVADASFKPSAHSSPAPASAASPRRNPHTPCTPGQTHPARRSPPVYRTAAGQAPRAGCTAR